MEAKDWLGLCDNQDCPRNSECKRYIGNYDYPKGYVLYEIKARCYERNNYAYFIRKD